MKIYFFGLSAFLLAVSISSCQKEIVFDEGGGSSGNPTDDSTCLSALVKLDTTYSSGLDTTEVITFTYDSKKRISQVFYRGYEAGTRNIEYAGVQTRVYSGSDTVPYRLTSEFNSVSTGDRYADTVFLFYSSAKLVQRDSSAAYLNGILDTRVASIYRTSGTGKMTKESRVYIGTDPDPLLSDITGVINQLVSGNITAGSDSFFVLQPSPEFTQLKRTDFIYDSGVNPFLRLMIPCPADTTGINDMYGALIVNPSRNNILTYSTTTTTVIGTSHTESNRLRYEYTKAGLPSVIRYSPTSDRAARKDKLYYIKL